MSIPFFFEPIRLTCRSDRFPRTEQEALQEANTGKQIQFTLQQRTSYIVDGGILSNFPVDLFDAPPDRLPRWPTLGFKLVAPNDNRPNRVEGPISLLGALFTTMMEAHDQRHMDEDAEVRTIRIRTENVKTTEFGLTPEKSEALYNRGRQGAEAFFERWNTLGGFAGYVAKYRQPLAKGAGTEE